MFKLLLLTMLSVFLLTSVTSFASCPPCPPSAAWGSAYVAIPAPIPGTTMTTSSWTGTVTTTKKKVKRMIGTMVFWFNGAKTYTVNTRNPVKYAMMCCGDYETS